MSFYEKVGTQKRSGAGGLRAGTGNSDVNVVSGAPDTAPPPIPASASPVSDTSHRSWAAADDAFWSANQTYDTLPSGLYRCGSDNRGFVLHKIRCDTDDLIELPDSATAEVLEEIRTFWTLRGEFSKRGFIFKRGVLLWGAPGSGKTATLQQLISIVIEKYKGIGLFIDHPGLAASCFQMIRRIEPERPIVALLEDLDALVERFGENEYLALLDGESQISNVTFVATTNYPERLDRRFVDRPSRFDTIREIGMPSSAARRAYLHVKEPSLTDAELTEWVSVSDGFSIAHLREMIILCRCYRRPLGEAVERLESMRSGKPSSDQADDGRRTVVGFRSRT